MEKSLESKKIAIVCDWIKDWGGAELVSSHLMETFPHADIYTSVFFQEGNPLFAGKKIHTSFIQKIPFLNKSHKLGLTLRPQAFEAMDLTDYDIVISSTSAESKGVITKPDCLHICYCHTPTRYFWSHYEEYLSMMEFGVLNPLGRWIMPKLIKSLRRWDYAAAQRPDFFIANSINTQKRIEKYYDRTSDVIYPAVDISQFPLTETKDDYYLAVGRCIPYKKFDLLVEAFNKNNKRLIIVTNTNNALYRKLKNSSHDNIEWKLNIPRDDIIDLYAKAKAFVFPPEEDFGLVPIEAQACGTPVIAYGVGGVRETVVEGATGVFFPSQDAESLNTAIQGFESMVFNPKTIRVNAEKFDKKIFQKNIEKFVEGKLSNKSSVTDRT